MRKVNKITKDILRVELLNGYPNGNTYNMLLSPANNELYRTDGKSFISETKFTLRQITI